MYDLCIYVHTYIYTACMNIIYNYDIYIIYIYTNVSSIIIYIYISSFSIIQMGILKYHLSESVVDRSQLWPGKAGPQSVTFASCRSWSPVRVEHMGAGRDNGSRGETIYRKPLEAPMFWCVNTMLQMKISCTCWFIDSICGNRVQTSQ